MRVKNKNKFAIKALNLILTATILLANAPATRALRTPSTHNRPGRGSADGSISIIENELLREKLKGMDARNER